VGVPRRLSLGEHVIESIEHAIDVRANIARSITQHQIPISGEAGIADRVAPRVLRLRMLITVNLDDDLAVMADEVEYVVIERRLAPEMEAQFSHLFKTIPELALEFVRAIS